MAPIIRQIREDDAEAFLDHLERLDCETRFMMLEPGERKTTASEQRSRIASLCASDNQTILVAEEDGQVVGHVAGLGGRYRRNRHVVHIVIGIVEGYTGAGLGRRLIAELESWARSNILHRLELTVMTHNERAVRLYRKCGFEVEGVRKDSLLVDGAYVDEYAMVKLLDGES